MYGSTWDRSEVYARCLPLPEMAQAVKDLFDKNPHSSPEEFVNAAYAGVQRPSRSAKIRAMGLVAQLERAKKWPWPDPYGDNYRTEYDAWQRFDGATEYLERVIDEYAQCWRKTPHGWVDVPMGSRPPPRSLRADQLPDGLSRLIKATIDKDNELYVDREALQARLDADYPTDQTPDEPSKPASEHAVEVSDPEHPPPWYPKTSRTRKQIRRRWTRAKRLRPEGPSRANLSEIATKIAEEELSAKSSENEKVERRAKTISKELGQMETIHGAL